MNYCSDCGHPVERRTPPGDHVPRYMCTHCGRIHYQNPKIVTGCIPTWGDRLLLCRRAIQPRLGYWTFPAGYLELGETSRTGAEREALEETGVGVEVGDLLAVISIPSISQMYIVHRAQALSASHHPTNESLETALVLENEIPWDLLAFPTIYHSLRFFLDDRAIGQERFHWMELLPPENKPRIVKNYLAVNGDRDGH